MIPTEKNLRILHSAALLSPPSGILAQMGWEQEAAHTLGIDWQVRMYCPANTPNTANILQPDTAIDHKKMKSPASKMMAWMRLRRNYHQWLLQQEGKVDIFILRYYVHDPYQLAFVRACKKPVYFLHHTLEVPELALPGGISGFLRSHLDRIIGRYAIRAATGIIGVTQEIVDYELLRADCMQKKSLVYPNGILFKSLALEDRRSPSTPELLFVANFAPWHGLDILLKELTTTSADFILHLVGKVPDNLMPLTKDKRVILHGTMNQQQIMEISAQCWLGIASLGLYRKKMKQACPLKVREYFMLGLPVYGDSDDIFPASLPFYKKGGGDISSILDFARQHRTKSKQDIAEEMHPWIDKPTILKRLYHEIVLDNENK